MKDTIISKMGKKQAFIEFEYVALLLVIGFVKKGFQSLSFEMVSQEIKFLLKGVITLNISLQEEFSKLQYKNHTYFAIIYNFIKFSKYTGFS